MSISDKYKKVLNSFGFVISDEDDSIMLGDEPIKVDGRNYYIPTQRTIDTIQNSNGEVVKHLFNPMNESILATDEPVIMFLLKAANVNLNVNLSILIHKIIEAGISEDLDADMSIAILLASLGKVKGGAKVALDAKSLSIWQKISDDVTSGEDEIIHLKIDKRVAFEGERYPFGLKVTSPFLRNLSDEAEDYGFRKKDTKVFETIIDFIVGEFLVDGYVGVSKDESSPQTLSLLKGYKAISLKIMSLLEKVLTEEELAQITTVTYTDDDVLEMSELRSEVLRIPNGVVPKLNKKTEAVEKDSKSTGTRAKWTKKTRVKPVREDTASDRVESKPNSRQDTDSNDRKKEDPDSVMDRFYQKKQRKRHEVRYGDKGYPREPRRESRYRDDRYVDDGYRDDGRGRREPQYDDRYYDEPRREREYRDEPRYDDRYYDEPRRESRYRDDRRYFRDDLPWDGKPRF